MQKQKSKAKKKQNFLTHQNQKIKQKNLNTKKESKT